MVVHECFINKSEYFWNLFHFVCVELFIITLMSTNPKRTAPITLAATVSSTVPSCI